MMPTLATFVLVSLAGTSPSETQPASQSAPLTLTRTRTRERALGIRR